MELLDYKMIDEELIATVRSTHGHIFKYSFNTETPEYEILEVLEEINNHVDNGRHPLGCEIIKNYDYDDVHNYNIATQSPSRIIIN
ncbi:hypothetical protein BUY43_05040 [Staphylococcus devriesei]|uniref:Uncharacterized protein n=2 Tax=Staphylococcus devriesei TaxID=586733 RepID=A0A2K4DUM3_9STAP|nr:hypothetical protein [Staphylococcus devriesei]MCE5090771.1 hypothetical protein [Staphylococcus devriesei]MCE5097784.1 hypothetical protein [Staphylococcus devriesei]PNZ90184.1 hypothetical protein CD147_01495 [Staphylococcus devriesei]PTE74514.1 hypothetical protein BUY44_01385 [Staphylococcus devriesei]PTF04150.1 hypothetical protein BUY45_04845 [Staphylococcus devriesei]